MSDLLLSLGQKPAMRKLVRSLGLPIPMPQVLGRAEGPWEQRFLEGRTIAVQSYGQSPMLPVLARTLAEAGVQVSPVGSESATSALAAQLADGMCEGPIGLGSLEEGERRFDALLLDASGLESVEDLRLLYDFFHPAIGHLAPCGRAIVLGRPVSQAATAGGAAAQAALDGFVRSLGKELGKRGSTAQLVMVEPGAEERLAGPLRFLLSPRSAYVSGQTLQLSSTVATANQEQLWTRALGAKVAMVTGAARGIGAATARLLAAEGAKVVCLDRPEDEALTRDLADSIGGSVLLADVSEEGAALRIAKHLADEHGGLDVLVHNAGITRDKTLARMDPDRWDQALDVNLAAVVAITEALLDGVLNDHGRIICLSSVAGIAGNLGQTNYAASKAGVIGLVQHLALRLADRGISANAIAPGFIETRLTEAIPVTIREVGRRLNSLGQGGQPTDVAEAISFLASPGSLGLSGQVLRVCGGAFIGA